MTKPWRSGAPWWQKIRPIPASCGGMCKPVSPPASPHRPKRAAPPCWHRPPKTRSASSTPNSQPAELVRPLFDELAESYDQHMVRSLKYQLPRQVADKIITRHPDKKINVL